MPRPLPLLVLLLLAASSGCSTLVANRLADAPAAAPAGEADAGPIRSVSETRVEDDRPSPAERPSRPAWVERQRFIFARAWQEIRRDLDYESIDSFKELAPEASREVRMMRDDLAGRGTASSRSGVPLR